ncbi:hypothetical protein [Clostridium neonatale]|uniref:Uncharacterized protein n=1 Tax=Clostridium neonatale TaxID=137838 RepID=A0AA86MR22_9CLOT|nr:hypothetical protein [Clostridium neonatale]CAG9703734.1 hypothetical protein CNEO_40790 [Clostridium neonatale]CAI3545873.1 hypothetical protein CNEO4_100059 [Clostridium neonatale]CAI3552946.1 hypothetical protein CNEO4_300060 [Clostridium neonatale]CAI3565547.1 hypothetical protein CNEO4_100003 [Clostridium neonatale]CAI3572326.1 hypothetical protein CNEO4_110036 [Clostridium neonatale]
MTVKQLRAILELYKDDMEVLVFIGRSGKDRKIERTMDFVNEDKEVIGLALEVEN